MMIYTTNPGNNSRRIARVTNKEIYPSYALDGVPTLSFDATGQDGVKYTIRLDARDIDRLNAALLKWINEFDSIGVQK